MTKVIYPSGADQRCSTTDSPTFVNVTSSLTGNADTATTATTATSATSAGKATNLVGGNGTTLLGATPYQSGTDTTTLLSPNTTTTTKFKVQTGNGTNGAAPSWGIDLSTSTSLGTSDTVVSSQKAVKSYVDTSVGGVVSGLIMDSAIDASGNPNYPATTAQHFFFISVAGKIGGASGTVVEAGDMVICITTNAGGTQASVGADFHIIQTNINPSLYAFLSGATFSGSISATNLSGTNTGDETTSTIKTKLGAATDSLDGYMTAADHTSLTADTASVALLVTTTVVTGTSQSAAVNKRYITNNAGLVTVTLPATSAVGSILKIIGKGAGGWKVAQNASQYIIIESATSATGTGGYIASTYAKDTITLVCTVADTEWQEESMSGGITVSI